MQTSTTSRAYVSALHTEWTHLGPSPARCADATPFAAGCPALADAATLDDVLRTLDAADKPTQDQILHALLTLAARGEQRAARTILQTMIPAILRQARTARARHLEDPLACAGAAMWEAIMTYPRHRRAKVAANLALESLRLIEAFQDCPMPIGDDIEVRLEQAQCAGHMDSWDLPDLEAATAVLVWALREEVVTANEAQLLAAIHLAEETPSAAQLAETVGCSAAAVRQRHSRLVRRIAQAVHDRCEVASVQDVVASVDVGLVCAMVA